MIYNDQTIRNELLHIKTPLALYDYIKGKQKFSSSIELNNQ